MKRHAPKQAKPSIIILHGWGLSGDRFLPLATSLRAKGYDVYAPDQPGFGTTALPDRALTLADYAAFVDRFVQERELDSPIIIGHSFGGRVALKYADLHPRGLRALILTGTPGYSSIRPVKYALSVVVAKAGNAIFGIGPLARIRDRVRMEYYRAVGARDFYRAEGQMRQTFKNVVREDLTGYMRRLTVPCLLLWGRDDKLVPLAVAEKMRQTIPGATLAVVDGTGHDLPILHTETAMPHIVRFLGTL